MSHFFVVLEVSGRAGDVGTLDNTAHVSVLCPQPSWFAAVTFSFANLVKYILPDLNTFWLPILRVYSVILHCGVKWM
jgi:hypothetical protein